MSHPFDPPAPRAGYEPYRPTHQDPLVLLAGAQAMRRQQEQLRLQRELVDLERRRQGLPSLAEEEARQRAEQQRQRVERQRQRVERQRLVLIEHERRIAERRAARARFFDRLFGRSK